jgi:GAF domain-containing protein
MPYVRCPPCGVTSFVVRSARVPATKCPECGSPLLAASIARRDDEPDRINAVVRLTRDLMDMDVALLTEIHDGRETAREAAGEWPGVGSLKGGSIPLEDTFCKRMLEGRIGNVVADVPNDEVVRDIGMARAFGVEAWIGVPIRLSDARLYVLCCLAREARPKLGERDLRMLRGLAESVGVELES